ncbi:MAG: septum formation protein Maf [Lachnospiraceae bacterium]|nr:septum formation protein Maf [Lachnospiraceae bacterium]
MASKRKIILASGSPRRKQLMRMAGLLFTVEPADVPEIIPDGMPAEKESEFLASVKAGYVLSQQDEKRRDAVLIVGADTIVLCEGRVLGKPKDKAEAKEMLRFLSGKVHEVYTGVAIVSEDVNETFTSVTKVEFYELTDEEIDWYVSTNEPMDKAGAYGIQGFGCRLVKRIEGDYFTVMGLPIAEVTRRIEKIRASENKG